jgi:4-hydroxybenzoate polyprenyltransferase
MSTNNRLIPYSYTHLCEGALYAVLMVACGMVFLLQEKTTQAGVMFVVAAMMTVYVFVSKR